MERELLLCAAELFARKGFGGTTLRDIADRAGVGRTTLYHYFGSKDDILAALVEDQTVRSHQDLRDFRARDDLDHKQKLFQAIHALALRVIEDPMRFRVVERDEANLPGDLIKQQQTIRRMALDELVAIIDGGMNAGQLRSMDPRLAALFIFGMTNWPAWWYNAKGARSPSELATEIANFAMAALSPPEHGGEKDPASMLGQIREDIDRLARMIGAQ